MTFEVKSPHEMNEVEKFRESDQLKERAAKLLEVIDLKLSIVITGTSLNLLIMLYYLN